MKRHRAGRARYAGDTRDMVDRREVKGPTTFGTFVVADAATYHPGTDATTVEFVTALDDDVVARDGAVLVLVDEAAQ